MEPQLWDERLSSWLWRSDDTQAGDFYYENGAAIKFRTTKLDFSIPVVRVSAGAELLDTGDQEMENEQGQAQSEHRMVVGQCKEEGLGMLDWGWNLFN